MKIPVSLALVVARGKNNTIGSKGRLPWHLNADMKFFKSLTVGSPIIMGRNTWQSLPKRPLPKRENIVVSRDGNYVAKGARLFTDLNVARATAMAIAQSSNKKEVFVIGGANLYETVLQQVNVMYITEVDANPEGDVFFPHFNSNDWKIENILSQKADSINDFNFEINRYTRKQDIAFDG